jgi:uncharacterized protein (DUF983 family)
MVKKSKAIDGMCIMRQTEMKCALCETTIPLKGIYFHLQIEKCPNCEREYSFRNAGNGKMYFQLIAVKKSRAKMSRVQRN